MEITADPDQMASSEVSWSGSTLFSKEDTFGYSRTRANFSWVVFYLYLLLFSN